jgi:aryl-alcohol dehydrogenase-like predicted oxidoreductase
MEIIHINPLKEAVSRICLGTWAIGGWMWGGTDEQESIKTIHAALDHGINIIDTAPAYGFGVSEKTVGKALQLYGNRDRIVIATKVGLEWKNNNVYRNSTPERIYKECEDSLQRLQTDYIDIYQIHWPDPSVPFAETAEAMLTLFKQGKIRAIGVSNYSPSQMEEFRKTAPIHVSQLPYNLFEREIEKEALPYTEKNNIVTFAYGSLCRGLLTGKMNKTTTFTGDDIRKQDPKFQSPRFEQYLNAVAALSEFAQKNYQKSVLALAVRWVLDRGHTVALWGARHPSQLSSIDEVMGWTIGADEMKEIDKILKENITDPIGPEFMAPPLRHP